MKNIGNQRCENIPPVTPRELAKEIRTNLKPKKSTGFDLITGKILKDLPPT